LVVERSRPFSGTSLQFAITEADKSAEVRLVCFHAFVVSRQAYIKVLDDVLNLFVREAEHPLGNGGMLAKVILDPRRIGQTALRQHVQGYWRELYSLLIRNRVEVGDNRPRRRYLLYVVPLVGRALLRRQACQVVRQVTVVGRLGAFAINQHSHRGVLYSAIKLRFLRSCLCVDNGS